MVWNMDYIFNEKQRTCLTHRLIETNERKYNNDLPVKNPVV